MLKFPIERRTESTTGIIRRTRVVWGDSTLTVYPNTLPRQFNLGFGVGLCVCFEASAKVFPAEPGKAAIEVIFASLIDVGKSRTYGTQLSRHQEVFFLSGVELGDQVVAALNAEAPLPALLPNTALGTEERRGPVPFPVPPFSPPSSSAAKIVAHTVTYTAAAAAPNPLRAFDAPLSLIARGRASEARGEANKAASAYAAAAGLLARLADPTTSALSSDDSRGRSIAAKQAADFRNKARALLAGQLLLQGNLEKGDSEKGDNDYSDAAKMRVSAEEATSSAALGPTGSGLSPPASTTPPEAALSETLSSSTPLTSSSLSSSPPPPPPSFSPSPASSSLVSSERDLRERLARLKGEGEAVPSRPRNLSSIPTIQAEMEARLARLKNDGKHCEKPASFAELQQRLRNLHRGQSTGGGGGGSECASKGGGGFGGNGGAMREAQQPNWEDAEMGGEEEEEEEEIRRLLQMAMGDLKVLESNKGGSREVAEGDNDGFFGKCGAGSTEVLSEVSASVQAEAVAALSKNARRGTTNASRSRIGGAPDVDYDIEEGAEGSTLLGGYGDCTGGVFGDDEGEGGGDFESCDDDDKEVAAIIRQARDEVRLAERHGSVPAPTPVPAPAAASHPAGAAAGTTTEQETRPPPAISSIRALKTGRAPSLNAGAAIPPPRENGMSDSDGGDDGDDDDDDDGSGSSESTRDSGVESGHD